ncbi:MAG: hypothetical protein ABR949_10270 [Candidatus Aquilonibacter sp.]|jgi:hypothetical protein
MSGTQGSGDRNVAWQALREALAALQVVEPLQNKTALGGGNYWVVTGQYISTGQTLVPIQLPRTPSGIIVVDNSTGGVVFRNSTDVAASGPSTYACRATTATSVTAIVI